MKIQRKVLFLTGQNHWEKIFPYFLCNFLFVNVNVFLQTDKMIIYDLQVKLVSLF